MQPVFSMLKEYYKDYFIVILLIRIRCIGSCAKQIFKIFVSSLQWQ